VSISPEEARAALKDGRIADAKTIIGLQWLFSRPGREVRKASRRQTRRRYAGSGNGSTVLCVQSLWGEEKRTRASHRLRQDSQGDHPASDRVAPGGQNFHQVHTLRRG